jgi:hypothetical protein
VSDTPKRRRPRKIDGWSALERWFAENPPERWHVVEAALAAIQDDSWGEKYRHLDDVTDPTAVVMLLDEEDDLVLVWRVIAQYPDYFRVIYLGQLDG